MNTEVDTGARLFARVVGAVVPFNTQKKRAKKK